jgi:hypothetical protein
MGERTLLGNYVFDSGRDGQRRGGRSRHWQRAIPIRGVGKKFEIINYHRILALLLSLWPFLEMKLLGDGS